MDRMSGMMSVRCAAILMALVAFVHPAAGQVTRVTARGQADGTGSRAVDEALKDAKRNAVEQACGLFINAQSQVENFQLIRDRILGQAVGYIARWNESRRWEEGGITYVEIVAEVMTAVFEKDWAAFAHLREDMDNPRCMFVITEDNDVSDNNPPKLNGICQGAMESVFLDKGVQLVDQSVFEQVRQRDVDIAFTTGSYETLAAVAARFSAEVLVLGNAEARPGGPQQIAGKTVYRWDVSLNVRAVQADSAKLIMSETYKLDKPFMTTSSSGSDEAFRKLAREVADRVLRDIAQAWQKRATSYGIFDLRIQNCSREDFTNVIKPALVVMRGVQQGNDGVKLRELVANTVHAEVYWSFDLNALADRVAELNIPGGKMRIIEQSGNRIVAEIVR